MVNANGTAWQRLNEGGVCLNGGGGSQGKVKSVCVCGGCPSSARKCMSQHVTWLYKLPSDVAPADVGGAEVSPELIQGEIWSSEGCFDAFMSLLSPPVQTA